ncbi:MAG: MotA/TolQ/ExbB proton channel family protein [Acidobacteriia bacterium]|nr:MotA/TolQ/ExbB proton channel family protein [Terriglobia bacterium]
MVNLLYASVLLIDSNLTNIIAQTGWVARGVLLILLVFSVISWALIFQKLGLFKQIRRDSERFLQLFRAARGLADPKVLATAGSPFTALYTAGLRELHSQVTPAGGKLKSLQAITVSMQLAAADEVRGLEKGMSWMATTGSITPFIGLFGTVWGVMDAFAGLGSAGAASLRAVAPGIAEALITTAAGLATAIPAVIFYNYFLQNIRDFAQRMDNFAAEVTALIEKTHT